MTHRTNSDRPGGCRLLLIEDDPRQAQGVQDLLELSPAGYQVQRADRLACALEQLARETPDLILLDLTLPDSQGLGSVHRVRQAAPETPIVVLTAVDDERMATESARRGVQDYLVKGTFKFEILERTVRVALERSRIQRMLETTNARLEREVRTDPLTLALNRRGLQYALDDEFARTQRDEREMMAILVDLDDFKAINDTFGHDTGDAVLAQVAARMRATLRSTDHLGRVGGDEFVVLLPDTRPAEARMIAEKLRLAIAAEPIDGGDEKLEVTASLGLATVYEDSLENLLANASKTLRQSKVSGRNRVTAPTAGAQEGADRRWLKCCARSISQGRSTPSPRRWSGSPTPRRSGRRSWPGAPSSGFESPIDFFRLSLGSEDIRWIDRRCLKVCARSRSRATGGRMVFLNVLPSTSPRRLSASCGLLVAASDHARTCLISRERQIVGDPGYLEAPIAALRAAGLKIALDDCGWGRGCLETLVLLRPEIMKLRPRLLREGAEDQARLDRMQRLIEVGRRIGCDILAEGVTSEAGPRDVRRLGIDLAQGPLLAAPPARGHPSAADSAGAGNEELVSPPALSAPAEWRVPGASLRPQRRGPCRSAGPAPRPAAAPDHAGSSAAARRASAEVGVASPVGAAQRLGEAADDRGQPEGAARRLPAGGEIGVADRQRSLLEALTARRGASAGAASPDRAAPPRRVGCSLTS